MRLRARFIDPKLKGHARAYVAQAALATVALLIALSVVDLLANAVIIAAIGSTAFILFVTPSNVMATPRHVIGGHAVCLATGAIFFGLVQSSTGQSLIDSAPFLFDLAAAMAVGLGILMMALTNTEHGPAAGTALGMVVIDVTWELMVVFVASVVAMSMVHQMLRHRLRDLM